MILCPTTSYRLTTLNPSLNRDASMTIIVCFRVEGKGSEERRLHSERIQWYPIMMIEETPYSQGVYGLYMGYIW